MSKYKVILSEFRDGECLCKALVDLNLPFEHGPNLRENGVTLKTDWVYRGEQNQQVAVAVTRSSLIKAGVPSYGGLGFAWNGKGYDLVQDSHNVYDPRAVDLLNKLRQRYSFHMIHAQARAHGLMVQESRSANGDIDLVLVGYNRR